MAMSDDHATGGAPPAREGVALSETSPRERPEGAGDIQTYIGARLRQVFDDVANQPVPDRFLQLMQELDRA